MLIDFRNQFKVWLGASEASSTVAELVKKFKDWTGKGSGEELREAHFVSIFYLGE